MQDPELVCTCGLDVALDLVGGQQQDTYRGECECGAVWEVEDYSDIYWELHCKNCRSDKNTILESGRCQDCEDNLT